MLDKLLSSLQGIPAYSILISAVVVIFIAVSVLMMFGTARQEKEIEQLRWEKVSAHMALYDISRRVVIPLEADEILIGRHGAADIRFTDMSVSRYHAVLYVSNGVWSIMDLIPNPEHLLTAGGFVRRSNSKTWTRFGLEQNQ